MNYFAEHFAAYSRFEDAKTGEAAQLSFLRRNPSYQTLCIDNKFLHKDVIRELIAQKLNIRSAKRLATITIEPSEIDFFLANEKRDQVIASLIPNLTDDQVNNLFNIGISTRSAIITASNLSSNTKVRVLKSGRCNANSVAILGSEVLDSLLVSDDDIWASLVDAAWPIAKKAPRVELTKLFWHRPNLLKRVDCNSRPEIISVAAGHISLDGEFIDNIVDAVKKQITNGELWAFYALIANPRVSVEKLRPLISLVPVVSRDPTLEQFNYRNNRPQILGEISAAPVESLRWLSSRAWITSERKGRPIEALELSHHPYLLDKKVELVEKLTELYLSYPTFASEISKRLADLGVEISDGKYSIEENPPVDEEDIEIFRSMKLYQLTSWNLSQFCALGESLLGSDYQCWDNLWALYNQLDSNMTCGELFDISKKI